MPTVVNNKPENVKLGVCSVTFDTTDLGFTKGGVQVAVATTTHEVTVDQLGNTPINELIMGRTCTVTVPLAETTLENLVATMPGATMIVDATDPTKRYVKVPTAAGKNLLSFAKTLVLHPKDKADTDRSDDFTVFKAATAGAITYSYSLDNERIFNVEFKAYPDADNDNELFAVGDTTAVNL